AGLPGRIGCGPERKHHTSALGPEGVPLRCGGVCASNRVTARLLRHAKDMSPMNTDQKTIPSHPPDPGKPTANRNRPAQTTSPSPKPTTFASARKIADAGTQPRRFRSSSSRATT
ncbi:hypothetical protein AB6Q13_14185, partial [Ralstonia solanacearum]|uniref:hypothetical protein n=1 Tax=Ralstonia solanacearum TaxID=305 RepID=UPI002305B4F2